jgi:biopolymer transport protein TolR
MAFTANGRTQSALSDINITPLVDVVLVLLLIFMVTAPVLQSGIEVAVPQTRTVNQISEEHLIVTIDKNQNVFLQDKPVNIHDLPRLLIRPRSPRSSGAVPWRWRTRRPWSARAT